MERYESTSSTEAPQAAEASSLPFAHEEEVTGPHSRDAGLELQRQERPSGTGAHGCQPAAVVLLLWP